MAHDKSVEDAFAELANYAEDVSQASRQTAQDAIGRFIARLDSDPLRPLVRASLPDVDFDAWYASAKSTVGSMMIGSGRLSWPSDLPSRVALQVKLLRRFADGRIDLTGFTYDFHYVENNYNLNLGEFANQTFRPAYRDLIALLSSRAAQAPVPMLPPDPRASAPTPPSATGGDATLPKRMLALLTHHPIVAFFVAVGIIIISLAKFTEALDTLADFIDARLSSSQPDSMLTDASQAPSIRRPPVQIEPDTVWGDPIWTEWEQQVIPATGVSRAHLTGTVSVTMQQCARMARESVETAVDWGGGDGSAWGQWIGGPVFSQDGRTVSRAYDHWKHDRPRAIRIRVQYSPCTVR